MVLLLHLFYYSRLGCHASSVRPWANWHAGSPQAGGAGHQTRQMTSDRADAAFAKPEIYEALEERGMKYAIRIAANDSLERDIDELLTRPVGGRRGGW